MPETKVAFTKEDFERLKDPNDNFVPLSATLDHEKIVQLSRQKGSTFFNHRRIELLNIDFHGEVHHGEVNWFLSYSTKKRVLQSDDESRKYKVVMFTPWGRLLTPHDRANPYENDSQRLVFEDKSGAILASEKLATKEKDPNLYVWY